MIVGERRSGPADFTTVTTAPVEAAHAVEQLPRWRCQQLAWGQQGRPWGARGRRTKGPVAVAPEARPCDFGGPRTAGRPLNPTSSRRSAVAGIITMAGHVAGAPTERKEPLRRSRRAPGTKKDQRAPRQEPIGSDSDASRFPDNLDHDRLSSPDSTSGRVIVPSMALVLVTFAQYANIAVI
jgi:hypothetical protein